MPDDDEDQIEGTDVAHLEDLLEVEVLMGWDGDRCQCPECICERFRDGADDVRCAECLAGRHSASGAGDDLR